MFPFWVAGPLSIFQKMGKKTNSTDMHNVLLKERFHLIIHETKVKEKPHLFCSDDCDVSPLYLVVSSD